MKLTPIASTHAQVSKLVPKGMALLVSHSLALMTDVGVVLHVFKSDRASENVVARHNNWSRYCSCCGDTHEDVQTGRRRCWTTGEPGSFVARNHRSRT